MTTELTDFSADPFISVIIRFFINLIVLFIAIRGIYYPKNRNDEYSFSFYLIGIMIFLVCILLQHVQITMGMAMGLFALFGILRFRSVNISIKGGTYFFTMIGISAINGLADFEDPVRGSIVINGIILATLFLLEYFFQKKMMGNFMLVYERLELLSPDKRIELVKDITERTKLEVEKVEIKEINLLKSVAELQVFYKIKK